MIMARPAQLCYVGITDGLFLNIGHYYRLTHQGKGCTVQHPINQSRHIVDVTTSIIIHIGANHADFTTIQNKGDHVGYIVDVDESIMVNITLGIGMSVLEQGYLLDVAPVTLGVIGIESLNPV